MTGKTTWVGWWSLRLLGKRQNPMGFASSFAWQLRSSASELFSKCLGSPEHQWILSEVLDQRLPVHKDFRHLHFMNQTWHFATLGGSSGQLPIQLPIPEDGIFECLWEEEMDFYPGNISFGDVHLLEECLDLDSYVSRFVKLALMQDPETEWPPSGSNVTALNCDPKMRALIIYLHIFTYICSICLTKSFPNKHAPSCPSSCVLLWSPKIWLPAQRDRNSCAKHSAFEGELKEYTYVMENRDMPKTVLEDASLLRSGLVLWILLEWVGSTKNHGSRKRRWGSFEESQIWRFLSHLWPQWLNLDNILKRSMSLRT